MRRALILDVVRHNAWATLELLDHCRSLSPEQWHATTPGTYGSILRTLGHIIGAEQYYLLRLTDEEPERWLGEDETYGPDELEAQARRSAERLERFLAAEVDPDRVLPPVGRSGRTTVGVVLTQLVHHGNEHRAQVNTVLGANGIETREVSGWLYGRRRGVSD